MASESIFRLPCGSARMPALVFLAWTWPLSHSTAQQQRDYLLKIGLGPTDAVLSLPHDLSPSTLGA